MGCDNKCHLPVPMWSTVGTGHCSGASPREVEGRSSAGLHSRLGIESRTVQHLLSWCSIRCPVQVGVWLCLSVVCKGNYDPGPKGMLRVIELVMKLFVLYSGPEY